jgi:hypothetical protein
MPAVPTTPTDTATTDVVIAAAKVRSATRNARRHWQSVLQL